MEINKLFNKEFIFINKNFTSKKDLLKFIAIKLKEEKITSSAKKVYQEFIKREEQISTGLGQKIAIPHLRSDFINKNIIVFIKNSPLEWNSFDNQNVEYVFAIITSKKEQKNNLHLLTLQYLAKLFLNSKFINELENVKNKDEFMALISDKNKFETQNNEKKISISNQIKKENEKYILAITSCPTGIAHTYLAAEKLKSVAKNMNIKIKVETQGANGIENKITNDDVAKADGLIIAVDRNIETIRFKNMTNVIETSTSKAIIKTKELIQSILDNKGKKIENITGSVSNESNLDDNEEQFSYKNFGKKSYKALLTGISYMLPFVVFGGIMIAISFLIDSFTGSPANGSFGSNNIAAAWFNTLGGIAFSLFVSILSAYICFAIVGRIGLLPGFVVGFISTGSFTTVYQRIFGDNTFSSTSSGFFGAIAGAFFAAAMIIFFMKYVLHKIPKSLQGIKQIIIVPFLGTLVIGSLFVIINIPLLYVNYGFTLFLNLFTGRAELVWLLGLITGIMMGVDLGGPINKAAYAFALTTLTSVNGTSQASVVMAAVMAAGMVPPITIALSNIISKKIWSKSERIEAQANWLFGFSFISEGAIPFTAKYPKRMIPANIISAGITGMVSSLLGIAIAAPHGGIFVSPLLSTTLFENLNQGLTIFIAFIFWLLAIFIGAFAGVLAIWLMNNFIIKNKSKSKKVIKMNKKYLKTKKGLQKNEIKWQDVKIYKLKNLFKKSNI